jgi:transposase
MTTTRGQHCSAPPRHRLIKFVRYRDEILQPHLMQVIDRQNNARSHTARVTMDSLEQSNINALPWPFKSSVFNTFEHLWSLKLVPSMTTTRGQHCSAPPRHRLIKFLTLFFWYCSPFLLQHLAEFIEGLSWRLSLAHMFKQPIP